MNATHAALARRPRAERNRGHVPLLEKIVREKRPRRSSADTGLRLGGRCERKQSAACPQSPVGVCCAPRAALEGHKRVAKTLERKLLPDLVGRAEDTQGA
eukprot:Amastigsp_a2455_26.p3 type:complete len:100 gc:universal Amastigsp_a2455_26:1027-1326(+)